MTLPLLALASLAALAAGYVAYGSFIARQYRLRDDRATPASARNDGIDFVPTRPFYLMGQHFSAIAAAGPIVGPVLACMAFGWGPCLLWIVLGVIFIGAVHDFSALVASVCHGAHSIADVAREHLGRPAYLALTAFIWLALVYVIVAFTDVTAATFVGRTDELANLPTQGPKFNPGGAVAAASVLYLLLSVLMGLVQRHLRPPMWLLTLIFAPATLACIYAGTLMSNLLVLDASAWAVLILGYCFVASLLPIWALQQPRGYLGGLVLYMTIGIGLIGILFGGFEIQQPAFRPVADYTAFFGMAARDGGAAPPASPSPRMTELIFPFLFVTIACGACSGFHGLVCGGTTSRQVAKESHCKPIAFGSMLLEGFVAIIALSTVMILSAADLKGYTGRPGAIYGDGLAAYLCAVLGIEPGSHWGAVTRTFGQMAVATFVFDTLDVSTRLGRYLLQELWRARRAATPPATPESAARGRVGKWGGVTGVGLAAAGLTAGVPLLLLLGVEKGSYLLFWTLFGTSNQLLAGLTLLGILVWLRRMGRPCWYVAVPLAVVMTITGAALGVQIMVGWRDAFNGRLLSAAGGVNPTVLNAAVAIALAMLAAFFIVHAVRAIGRGRGMAEATTRDLSQRGGG